MNKKIKLISICIIFLLCVIGYIYNTNNNISLQDNNVTYAISLDGKKTSSFPARGSYKVQVECNNAVGKWLYDEWKLSIEDMLGTSTSCDIDFTSITTKTLLSDYVISLVGKSQGTGKVINENGYRYEGKNPNNYIWFNNEYWRIIGVFDSATHGQAGKNLVKIIRDKQIGYQTWDSAGTNNWSTSSLKSLLNDYYYKATDGTNSGKCYGYSNTVTSNCNYTKNGIQSYYRNLIQSVTWHLGGNSIAVTANNFYTYERGTTVNGSNPTTTTGYIGLMYPSDFGYTALESDCARTTLLSEYITVACAGASWLSGRSFDLTLTQYTTNATQTISISREGKIAARDAIGNFGVSPVLYLNSSVYLVDGNGSLDNPYIIAS
ncbi:MAG: hypothetical protein U0M92_01425 [Bacilli bacterium]